MTTDHHHIDPELISIVDEISDRLQRGESVDVESYAQQLPQHGDYLRQLVRTLRDVADLGLSSGADAIGGTKQSIGEFEIVGQIGRGGMGVVYEAIQGTLERRVALKVLPFASLSDERQLKRFKNEARAAATLHHNHIVPVHSVGSDKGIHYYAMQYIDGPSMAEVIQTLKAEAESTDAVRADKHDSHDTKRSVEAVVSTARSKSPRDYFRRVAKWGEQAADALAHAHENGVLHRDIKPGNILLDRLGDVWITDFGLARLESDASMTRTGDVIGTLRYMAPEQAIGDRVLIDHRADIYALGVTLYEMLTLTPAFQGVNRQTLLNAITSITPVAPIRLDSDIPVELETIVMKAIEKDPRDRYESAAQFASDLRRFQDNRPILARRPSITTRCRKLIARHTAIVSTAVISLLVAAIVIAVVSVVASNRVRDSLSEVNATNVALRASEQETRDALDVATQAINRFYVQFATDWMENETELTEVQQEFLQAAADVYDRLEPESDDPNVTVSAARAHHFLGTTHQNKNDADEAFRCYQRAEDLLESLPPEFFSKSGIALSTHTQIQINQFQIVYWRERNGKGNNSGIARTDVKNSIDQLERYIDEHPEDLLAIREWIDKSRIYGNSLIGEDDLGVKRKQLRLAERLLDELGENRHTLRQLGALHLEMAQARVDADENYSRCIELTRRLIKSHPESKLHRSNLGSALESYANYKSSQGDFQGAREQRFNFKETLEELEEDFPNTLDYAERARKSHLSIGDEYLKESKQSPNRVELLRKAEEHFKKSLEVNQEFLAVNPRNTGALSWITFSLGHMISVQNRLNQPDEAAVYMSRLIERLEHISDVGDSKTRKGYFDLCRNDIIRNQSLTPQQVDELMNVAVEMLGEITPWTCQRIFNWHSDNQRSREAFEFQLAYTRKFVEDHPKDGLAKFQVSGVQTKGPYPELCDFDEALTLIERANELKPDNPVIQNAYGWALYRLDRANDALEWFKKSYDHKDMGDLLSPPIGMALCYDALGKQVEGNGYFKEGLARIGERQILNRSDLYLLYEAAEAFDATDQVDRLLETRWPGPRRLR